MLRIWTSVHATSSIVTSGLWDVVKSLMPYVLHLSVESFDELQQLSTTQHLLSSQEVVKLKNNLRTLREF